MARNISCTIHIKISCIQECFSKQMKAHINISSKQAMQKSTKIRNNPTSSMHIVMHIMQDIYLKYSLSHQQITYSMLPSLTGVTRKNSRHLESVPMQKQEQFTLGVPTKIWVIFYTRVVPMKTNEFYSTFNSMRWNSVVEWY